MRRVARGDALRAGDDVGDVVVLLAAEPRTDATEGADHFVRDEQHAVAVADLAHLLPVAGRGSEAAARVLHRLEEDGRDGLGTLAQDGLFDLASLPEAEGFEVVRVALGPIEVDGGHLDGARHQRLVGDAVAVERGDGECAERGAVIGDVAADDLVAVEVAAQAVVLAG